MMEAIESLPLIDKWDTNMTLAVLSGKLIPRTNKQAQNCEFHLY